MRAPRASVPHPAEEFGRAAQDSKTGTVEGTAVGRVVVHIEGARGWLERAEREWRRGSRARALLDLSLAEAEVRLARRAAATEPLPGVHRRPAVVFALAATGLLAVALAGGLRGPTREAPPRSAHAAVRAVSLGYVPGAVLGLVAPPREGLVARPWAVPTDESAPWLRDLLREAGVEVDGLPAQPASFR